MYTMFVKEFTRSLLIPKEKQNMTASACIFYYFITNITGLVDK